MYILQHLIYKIYIDSQRSLFFFKKDPLKIFYVYTSINFIMCSQTFLSNFIQHQF